MKCPNCNESDHEPMAKFCHNCGSLLNPEAHEASKKLMAHGKKVQEAWERMRLRQAAEEEEESSSRSWWNKTLRFLMLIAVLIEYIIISIAESDYGSWGWFIISFVNGFVFIITTSLYFLANMSDFENKKRGWRLYYEWLHFFAAAFVSILGYIIVFNFQNFVTFILGSSLVGIMILADFGTLEDIIEV